MGDDNRNFMNNQNGQNNSGGNNGNKKDDKKNTNRVSLLISMATALIKRGFTLQLNLVERLLFLVKNSKTLLTLPLQ